MSLLWKSCPLKENKPGAAFYLVLADGKHKLVSDTVKGGENARKITIKYENQNHQLSWWF
ncbi:MAG: hypothetical protein J6Q80_01170 [Lentisphaeria bacterium]|nr:hypothetical protein [Lentisphaeria bacterium]